MFSLRDDLAAVTKALRGESSASHSEVSCPTGVHPWCPRSRPWRTRESWPPCYGAQRWLEAGKIWYAAPDSEDEHVWEMVRRVSRNAAADGTPAEAADVVASVRRRGEEPSVVFIVTYRPPVDAWVVELPAGMVDAGETVPEAAARELKERRASPSMRRMCVCFSGVLPCATRHLGRAPRATSVARSTSTVIQVMEVLVRRHGCLLEPRGVGLAQGLALARAIWGSSR